MQRFAERLGGTLACINTKEEKEFLEQAFFGYGVGIGLDYDIGTDKYIWVDGTKVKDFILEDDAFSTYEYDAQSYGNWLVGETNAYKGSIILIELPAQYVTSIQLDSYEVTIDTETAWQIGAKVGPSEMADTLLIYESMDPAVAEVSRSGKVTGLSTGDAVIRVYSPDKQIWRELTVHVMG